MKKVFVVVIFFLFMSFVVAVENITDYENAIICIAESKGTLNEMEAEGFNVQRINDSLSNAVSLFDAQSIIKQRKRNTDFSLAIAYCDGIATMKSQAFSAKDEFDALKKFYDESLTEEMNLSSIDKIILEIENEIESERYEKIAPLIEEGYDDIINIKASHTVLNLAYKTTTRNLKTFFYESWKYLLGGFIIFVVAFVLFKNTLFQIYIKHKIKRLEFRKTTIKKLIGDTQRMYFENGNISESSYNIRVKKFAELIRDIDRQIPLLYEQLIKILRKEKKEDGKY